MSFDTPLGSRYFWDTTFGLYQLVPFLLAIYVVLLEIGLVEKLPKLQRGIMLTAPLLIVPAYPWLVPWSRLPAYVTFTNSVVSDFASPVFITIVGLALLYGRAWRKGVQFGQAGFYGMIFLAGSIGPRAFGSRIWNLQTNLSYWPLLVLGVVQLIIAFRRRQSTSAFIAIILLVCAVHFSVRDFSELNAWRTMITLHLAFAATLVIGLSFRDDFAEVLRDLGPPFLSFTMFSGIISLIGRDTGWLAVVYATSFTILALALGRLLQNSGYLTVTIIHCGLGGIAGIGVGTFAFLRVHLPSAAAPHVVAAAAPIDVTIYCARVSRPRTPATVSIPADGTPGQGRRAVHCQAKSETCALREPSVDPDPAGICKNRRKTGIVSMAMRSMKVGNSPQLLSSRLY
jgi:hypothetical protein